MRIKNIPILSLFLVIARRQIIPMGRWKKMQKTLQLRRNAGSIILRRRLSEKQEIRVLFTYLFLFCSVPWKPLDDA